VGKELINLLRNTFAAQDRIIGLCSISVLPEVSRYLESKRSSGQISEFVYQRYLKGFEYAPPERLPSAKSLLLVVSPIGRSVIELDTPDGLFEAVIPPTYGAEELIDENEALFGPLLKEADLGFSRAWVPVKSIAARCGLGRYGRMNVLYFEGMGSYARIDAWWTELPAEGEPWGPPQNLERCAICGACERVCPADCFPHEGFIIDATQCITFLNEGDDDFPASLDPHAHTAAVGCLRCQDACPENRAVLGKSVYRRFTLSREASEALIAGRGAVGLPESSRPISEGVIRATEMVGHEGRLGRNLRALLAAKRDASSPEAPV
jgi:epoxyqueuosine reductase